MPRINVPFVVEKQRIALLEPVELVAGGQNYFYATFNLCKTWKKISGIKALFTRGDISKLMTLTAGEGCMECQIPWEVMEDMGVFHVGIFGGDRLLTNMTYVVVRKGCLTEGGLPEEPTPDWFKIIEEKVKNAENVANKVTALNDTVTDEQYPSAKVVWDALKNTGGITVSDFIELNLGGWDDFDNLNHHHIKYNKACNLIYKGLLSECIPYVLLVQIACEDIPRTFQTLWSTDGMTLNAHCETRCFGAEFGGDDSNAKWTEWKSYGGSGSVDTSKFEKISNKVTAIDENSTDNQYPSAKAVWLASQQILEDFITRNMFNEEINPLKEKIGSIDSALVEIIAIQNQLMGVSE